MGTTSASQPVTLSNTGNGTLTITSIATSVNFGESDNCHGSVAAVGSCTINVTFTPTAAGTLTGTLTITDNSNGVTGSTQTVSLTGTGTAPIAAVSPGTLTLGSQTVGTTSPSQPVTLSNTGTAPLTIASIVASVNFGESDNCHGSVAAVGSCTINVTFTPTAAGALSGTLTITDNSNGVTGSTQTVSLSGTGTGVALASLSASSLSFGNQPVGTSTAAQVETVTNTGTINLTISTVATGGTNVSDFAKSADTCTGATVIPSHTCTVSVTFTPAATGARSGTLTFTDNNNNVAGSTQTVTLTGTGVDFAVSPSPSTQSVAQGGNAVYTVNVTSVSGTFSNAVTLACGSLPAATTCAFATNPVTPGAAGSSSQLTVTTTAPHYARMLPPPCGLPPGAWPVLLLVLMLSTLVGSWRVRRLSSRWAATCLLFAVVLAVTFVAACGQGGFPLPKIGGTPVGTYTITITGTSGSLQHSTTGTLTVTGS